MFRPYVYYTYKSVVLCDREYVLRQNKTIKTNQLYHQNEFQFFVYYVQSQLTFSFRTPQNAFHRVYSAVHDAISNFRP